MPSLKPNRLRGVSCDAAGRRGPAEAELGPADRRGAESQPGQVADRVHGDLGSSAQACTHRSPSLRAGSSWSAGKWGSRSSTPGAGRRGRTGRARRRPRRAPARSRTSGSAARRTARPPRRCRGAERCTAPGRRLRPAARPSAARRPPSIAAAEPPARPRSSVVTSKAAKCSRSWAGVRMPAWCRPWNGTTWRPRRARRPGRCRPLRRRRPARCRPRHRAARAGTPPNGRPLGAVKIRARGPGRRPVLTRAPPPRPASPAARTAR